MAIDIESPKIRELFWGRVQPAGDNECWPWMRETVGALKYGRIRIRDGNKRWGFRANRLAFRLAYGRWPVFACHSCDNPLCCNPKHIFDGTPLDNMRDMHSKNRARPPKGEGHWKAKLTNEKVLNLRADYSTGKYTQDQIAEKYGCSRALVSLIARNKNWKHV